MDLPRMTVIFNCLAIGENVGNVDRQVILKSSHIPFQVLFGIWV